MSSSKFFDPEWVRLSQMLQQSLDRYEREERERAKGAATDGRAAVPAAGEEEQRRRAGPTVETAAQARTVGADVASIFLNSVAGQEVPKTLRFLANIDGRSAMTLVDNCASLNFIGAKFAKTLVQEACEVEAKEVESLLNPLGGSSHPSSPLKHHLHHPRQKFLPYFSQLQLKKQIRRPQPHHHLRGS
ncbi:unnamed protein product [Linum trigynum]|uniref:Uncharacterized protein n=1 Tax=Linum trigynum TaxID=586398 RepID=A0AAV2EE85_9ROSI